MASIINATTNGLIYSSDMSGTLQIQSGGVTALTISGNTVTPNSISINSIPNNLSVTGNLTATQSVTANTGNITSISANTVFANTVNSVSVVARTGYGLVGTLNSNTTVNVDLSQYNNWSITLANNATLANATNTTVGQSGVIYITQDTTGSRTLAYGSMWKFLNATAPTLSTAANSVDILVYTVQSSTRIDANLLTNFN